MLEALVHLPDVASALGLLDTRAVKGLCLRHQIPIVRLNKRQRAIRETHYRLLLDLMSDYSEAA